jgi:hypothetical protein
VVPLVDLVVEMLVLVLDLVVEVDGEIIPYQTLLVEH